jgi:aspartate carbamoyltransferase catalytic subunit
VQKERFASAAEYDLLKHAFVVTPVTMSHCKPPGKMVLLHPLPRVGEIDEAVDSDPRAAYFRQMRHGMFVRSEYKRYLSCVISLFSWSALGRSLQVCSGTACSDAGS